MTGVTPRGRRWELVGAGVLVLLVAAFFGLGITQSLARQWRASRAYVEVPATLIRAEVTTRGGNRTTSGGSFVLDLAYRYEVDGRAFENARLAWAGQGFATRDAAERMLAELRGRSPLTAHYDPSDPARAVLDPSPPPLTLALVPAGFAVLGGLVVMVGLRRRP